MPDNVISSRQFNQGPGSAERAAAGGPVLITYRGEPSHVLLTIDGYRHRSAWTRPWPHSGCTCAP